MKKWEEHKILLALIEIFIKNYIRVSDSTLSAKRLRVIRVFSWTIAMKLNVFRKCDEDNGQKRKTERDGGVTKYKLIKSLEREITIIRGKMKLCLVLPKIRTGWNRFSNVEIEKCQKIIVQNSWSN